MASPLQLSDRPTFTILSGMKGKEVREAFAVIETAVEDHPAITVLKVVSA
jgi:hypothetical protein